MTKSIPSALRDNILGCLTHHERRILNRNEQNEQDWENTFSSIVRDRPWVLNPLDHVMVAALTKDDLRFLKNISFAVAEHRGSMIQKLTTSLLPVPDIGPWYPHVQIGDVSLIGEESRKSVNSEDAQFNREKHVSAMLRDYVDSILSMIEDGQYDFGLFTQETIA